MRFLKFTKPYKLRNYNFTLITLVVLLSVLGVLVVGSARADMQNKQIFGVAVGIAAMFVISLIDYVWVLNFYWLIYIFGIVNLVLVLLIGAERNNAKRWIDLGFTTFQPSELVKILLILFCAQFIMNHQDDINDKITILKYTILCVVPLLLIYKEPNLTTTLLTAFVLALLYYIGGLSYKIMGMVLAIVIPLVVVAVVVILNFSEPLKLLGYEYQQKRIVAFFNQDEYKSDEAYQQLNSEMAIGSGQLMGKGLNNNTTTSLKNGDYILEPQTDFIFAIVGEELGFVGSVIVIAFILMIVLNCIMVGVRSQDKAGLIICCGVGGLIAAQSFVNMGVAMNMLPNTGVPLPFVSYGLTSLVSLYMGIGFVLNVGLQPKKY